MVTGVVSIEGAEVVVVGAEVVVVVLSVAVVLVPVFSPLSPQEVISKRTALKSGRQRDLNCFINFILKIKK